MCRRCHRGGGASEARTAPIGSSVSVGRLQPRLGVSVGASRCGPVHRRGGRAVVWYHQGRSGGRGRECTYSGVAIQCLLVIKLPLRAMSGLAGIAGAADGTGPSYRRVCRRLEVAISARPIAPMTSHACYQAIEARGVHQPPSRRGKIAVPWPVTDETPRRSAMPCSKPSRAPEPHLQVSSSGA